MPYQGIGPAVASILGGNVDLVIGLPNAIMPQVSAGKLVGLGTTGVQRSELMPTLMTMKEGGVDMSDVTKFGFFAPKGTPDAVMKKLIAAVAESVKVAEFVEPTRRSFNGVMYMDPAQFKAALETDSRYFQKLIRDLKLAEQ